ncbi:hypothetical protein ACFO3O_01620 [Dokdonia ponticola]|uniref:Uncharacterized protein n=1 Tax=Dokdonia ponticola TaxID=2041041 RepID=A0ABV9HTJ6_9FLAO
MEKNEFLEKHIFTDLQNLNTFVEADGVYTFSEANFATVLERVAHFGIGIYAIETSTNGDVFDTKTNEDYKKKVTDPKWYKRAYIDFKKRQANLNYTATYRISDKLLAKEVK